MGLLPYPRRDFCSLPFFLSETTLSFLIPERQRGVFMTLRRHLPAFICLIALSCAVAAAQRRNADPLPVQAPAQEQAPKPAAPEPKKEVPEQPPVVTHHEVHVGGKTLRYTATPGIMPLRTNDTGAGEAHSFYIA